MAILFGAQTSAMWESCQLVNLKLDWCTLAWCIWITGETTSEQELAFHWLQVI